MATIPELGPREFMQRWPGFPDGTVILLDVREAHELSIASIPGTLDIPMGEIPGRLADLNTLLPIVVLCRSGARSLHVADFLAANGCDEVYNLRGGINAWAREVDPSVPCY
jgi:rhodanese-related sulfurtransferase